MLANWTDVFISLVVQIKPDCRRLTRFLYGREASASRAKMPNFRVPNCHVILLNTVKYTAKPD